MKVGGWLLSSRQHCNAFVALVIVSSALFVKVHSFTIITLKLAFEIVNIKSLAVVTSTEVKLTDPSRLLGDGCNGERYPPLLHTDTGRHIDTRTTSITHTDRQTYMHTSEMGRFHLQLFHKNL